MTENEELIQYSEIYKDLDVIMKEAISIRPDISLLRARGFIAARMEEMGYVKLDDQLREWVAAVKASKSIPNVEEDRG